MSKVLKSAKAPGIPVRRAGADLRDHPNLKDHVATYIREGIVSGRFGPGDKIDQDEVAATLGVSRLPVREALIELAQNGYVAAIPRRGAFVADLGVDDVEDHYAVVGMVVAVVARRAAKELSRAQLRDLRKIHGEIAATADLSVQEALNREFYAVINHSGGSARLLSILQFLSGALVSGFYLSSPWGPTEEKYREQMIEALESRDADAAANVAEEHLHECGRVTIEELRERGYWTDEASGNARQRASRGPAGRAGGK
jgi:DNA-binding GntR family transcriptional regulator